MTEARPNYGIDAPNIVRNLFIAGTATCALGFLIPALASLGFLSAIGFFVTGALMINYAQRGKYRVRDLILSRVSWRGDETVLDVGTGRGLLVIGAAKRLRSGSATGIDIWNAEDLSGNNIENTLQNADLEGVKDKVYIKNEDARRMNFAEQSFDVVISNLCLHNIYDAEERSQALGEIVRVLKHRGRAVISDFRHVHQYADFFRSMGLTVKVEKIPLWIGFPPLTMVIATKS
jgi:arsenite methyltransferase